MKKAIRKKLAVMLAVLTMVSGLAACGGDKDASSTAGGTESAGSSTVSGGSGTAALTEPGTFPISEELQEFDIMVPQYSTLNPEEAWVTDAYQEKTNVKLNWTVIPTDGWHDRVSIAFAGGDMPDVIAGMDTLNITPTEELQYATQGLLLPLNDVIDRNSVELKAIMAENPQIRKLVSQDDGEIYSLPGLAVCYHCNYSQKMFINQTWLDNLGLETPTTTEEFYEVLKKFQAEDANGNGDPNDEIPLITNIDGWHVDLDGFLMCSFIYSDPDSKMAVEDGKVIFTPTQEGYREGLRYLNKLYAEGLISPESFTNDEATNTRMNVAGGDAAVIGAYPFAYQNYTSDTEIWKQYEILAPLEGPDGFVTTPNYALTRDVIRGNFAITKNAENPDLIMRWVDYFYGEEGTMFRLGREGTDWRKAEPGELDFNGDQAAYALMKLDPSDPYYVEEGTYNVDWTQNIPVNYSQKYRESAVAAQDFRDPDISNGTEIQLFQGTKAYEAVARPVTESLPNLTVSADQISDYSRIKTEIESYCENSMVQFITGSMSLENDWDSYLSQLDQLGLQDYMEMSNEAYQNFLNR